MNNINEDKLAVGFIIAGDSINISGQLRKSDENAIVSEQDFLGVISIKDLLLVMTEKKILPVLEWLNEERHKHEIEERSGYSE